MVLLVTVVVKVLFNEIPDSSFSELFFDVGYSVHVMDENGRFQKNVLPCQLLQVKNLFDNLESNSLDVLRSERFE